MTVKKFVLLCFLIAIIFITGIVVGSRYNTFFSKFPLSSNQTDSFISNLIKNNNKPYSFMTYVMYKGVLTDLSDDKIVLLTDNSPKPIIIPISSQLKKVITYTSTRKAANSPIPAPIDKSSIMINSSVTLTVIVDLTENKIQEINLRVN